MIECPRHEEAFDCSPFCRVCGGEQEYDPSETLKCVAPDCSEQIAKDTWIEELGFCVEDSNAYYSGQLDYVTLRRIA